MTWVREPYGEGDDGLSEHQVCMYSTRKYREEHPVNDGTHQWRLYQGGYATYKLSGGVPAVDHPDITAGGTARATPGKYVPVGQGFYVIGHATNSGPVEFKNSQ